MTHFASKEFFNSTGCNFRPRFGCPKKQYRFYEPRAFLILDIDNADFRIYFEIAFKAAGILLFIKTILRPSPLR